MRLKIFIFISLMFCLNFTIKAELEKNLNKSGVILQGYDVISYFDSKEPKKGTPAIQTQYEGATYQFVSKENKQKFLQDPQKYAPQFGGWCAYAVADSKSKVDIDPKSFLIQDGRLLLFYNAIWANTRKKWLKDSKGYLKTADANWPEVQKQEP